jgi:hypothetical protein
VVTVRAFIVMAALAGCGQPSPLFCADDGSCGGGLCIDQLCAQSDPACASGYRYHESAGEKAGDCTGQGSGSGNGTDGGNGEAADDPITTLTTEDPTLVDASKARDDFAPSCATNPMGRDVMYEIDVPAGFPRLYVDTYLTMFDVVLAVYEGSCASITASHELGCVNSGAHACDSRTMQWSKNVRAGVHCIVVDQAGSGPASNVFVRAITGPAATSAEKGVTSGNTCNMNRFGPSVTCTAPDSIDTAWFYAACPGSWLAMLPASWPGDIEARTASQTYDCQPADTGALFVLSQPGPVWLIAHQAGGSCGAVSVNVQPY